MQRKIKDFPNYSVDKNGVVYNNKKNHKNNKPIVKKHKDKDGYDRVALRKNNKAYTKIVHRLVAIAFIPNPENKPQVNHKDGNKQNNCIHNLEWATQSENMRHLTRVLKKTNVGEKASRSKLKTNQVIDIYNSKECKKIICKKYNISKSQVIRIKNKKNWGHLWK